jgi:hypothetical protein
MQFRRAVISDRKYQIWKFLDFSKPVAHITSRPPDILLQYVTANNYVDDSRD